MNFWLPVTQSLMGELPAAGGALAQKSARALPDYQADRPTAPEVTRCCRSAVVRRA